ncbi:MAG TPA: cytochrome P450 [Candidatus Limnocylindria bacterium]|nr:cytochrome P450 [Candidatus Limnocylindria bacterium]
MSHPIVFVLIELLRRMGGVVRVPGLGVAVSDVFVARSILGDEEHFSKTGPGSAGVFYDQVMGRRALLNMDGAEHLALRKRIGDLFSPAYLRVVAHDVLGPSLGDLERRLNSGETVDLVAFTHLLTGRMMCHELGFTPPAGREDRTYLELYDLGDRLISSLKVTTRQLSPRDALQARRIFDELMGIARRSDTSNNSMVTRLRSAGLDGNEVEAVLGSLFLVGTQSVSTALPRIVALLLDTDQMRRLRTEPQLMQQTIDEALRLIVPSPLTLRRVSRSVILAGHRFHEGERVLVLMYNAAKDDRVFPSPGLFDIERRHPPAGRHIWFGVGQHFCLGFSLAQFEIRWVLEALLRVGDLEIVGRSAARHVLLPSYRSLRIRRKDA